jgi:hypothetical protein
MNKSQAIADLAIQLSEVTTAENALTMIQRALRMSGLTHVNSLTDADMNELLSALAAEGGLIQNIAEQIAINGLDADMGPTAA